MDILIMAHKVYDYPIDSNTVEDIRKLVKQTNLAREKNTIDD